MACLRLAASRNVWLALCCIVLLRVPSLFIEYYDEDELMYATCAVEVLHGATPYVDFAEQKPPLIHYLYAGIFFLFGERNLYAVHAFALLVVLFTVVYLYRAALVLLDSELAAFLSALAYGIYVSAFDESHMATNGELLFNAPLVVASYYFLRFCFAQGPRTSLVSAGIWIAVAVLVKQQSASFLVCAQIFLCFRSSPLKETLRAVCSLTLAFVATLFLVYGVLYAIYGSGFLYASFYWTVLFPSSQADVVQRASWGEFFGMFLRRQGPLWVVQAPLWIALGRMLVQFLTKGNFQEHFQTRRLFLLLLFSFAYLPVFVGGVRFHHHYFMQYLPALCLIFAAQIVWMKEGLSTRRLVLVFLPPVLFFSVWHWHDVYTLYFSSSPSRARNPNYLVQRPEYQPVTRWIHSHSAPDDRIFVWGDAPNLYYFAERRLGARFFVFNYITLDYVDWFESKVGRSRTEMYGLLGLLVEDLRSKKPRYFIDISPSGINGSARYPVHEFPVVYQYLVQNYRYQTQVNFMNVWERKSGDVTGR